MQHHVPQVDHGQALKRLQEVKALAPQTMNLEVILSAYNAQAQVAAVHPRQPLLN